MEKNNHLRPMRPCRWRGCKVTVAIMPNDLCILHHYWAQGKECPGFERKRPSVDRNVTRTNRTDTSRASANKALPESGTKRRTVYDAVIGNMSNGMTCDEVCEQTGMLVQSCTSAINTLAADGWLYDSGMRRPTRTGHMAIVWVAL